MENEKMKHFIIGLLVGFAIAAIFVLLSQTKTVVSDLKVESIWEYETFCMVPPDTENIGLVMTCNQTMMERIAKTKDKRYLKKVTYRNSN
jgi:hypothetical protein